jgi:hypothetical protein
MSQMTTHTLDVPGATLTYDVRRNDASTEPVMFRSNHGGFRGDEYGRPGRPDAFAAKLCEVLAPRA